MSLQRTKFLDLPNELICMISRYIGDDHGINALLQTCKRLFLLLNTSLYKYNVNYSNASALEWAAEHGIEITARHALEAGASPDAMYCEGWVPMALACIHDHEAIVRLLLDHGFDPDPDDRPHWIHGPDGPHAGLEGYERPMVLAASRGHESIVKLLLTYGVDVDTPASDDETPLMIAAEAGHLSVVKVLASSGADLNLCTEDGATPIQNAVIGGSVDVVRYLLEAGADIEADIGDYEGRLNFAVGFPGKRMVTFMLEYGANSAPKPGKATIHALASAAELGDHSVAKMIRDTLDMAEIISSGAPSDDSHKKLLLASAVCGWEDLVLELLEQGCPPNAKTPFSASYDLRTDPPPWSDQIRMLSDFPSALTLAAHQGHLSVVQILLRYGADLNEEPGIERSPNPLCVAVSSNHRHIVQALLDHGANPNYRDVDGCPVLFRAVRMPEIFQLLLDYGAITELTTNEGDTILAKALRFGSIATVEILRPAVSFDQPWVMGDLAFTYISPWKAAIRAGKAMVEYLLDRGYVIKPGSCAVEDALIRAVRRANAPLVGLLFERGLVGTLLTSFDANIFAIVGSCSNSYEAIAATMDQLLVHGVDIEAVESPLFRFLDDEVEDNHRLREYHFKQFLSRGAAPWEKTMMAKSRYHMRRAEDGGKL